MQPAKTYRDYCRPPALIERTRKAPGAVVFTGNGSYRPIKPEVF